MLQSHINTLSLASIIEGVQSFRFTKQKEERLIRMLVQSGLNEYTLNCLYHLIKYKASWPQEQLELLFKVEFIVKLAQWIINDHTHARGIDKTISPRSQIQIIELMHTLISLTDDEQYHSAQIYATSQEILTHFYVVVDRSERLDLRGKYLDCISKMFRMNPNIFNVNIYAEMLSVTEEKVAEFYEFLDYYLLQREVHDEVTVCFIFEGFAKRMRMFSERTMITRIEYRGILKAYSKLITFLRSHLRTQYPEKVLSKYSCIYEYLLSFVNKGFEQHDLCKVFNSLIEVYMQSSVYNLLKFKFVLSLYKEILKKSASMFGFLSTATLTGDQDFLHWFLGKELSDDKEEEALQTYFRDQHSLQFLLVLVIFCCVQLPERAEHVARFMRAINLPSESEGFLYSDEVKEYLQAYYSQIGDMESLDDLHLRRGLCQ